MKHECCDDAAPCNRLLYAAPLRQLCPRGVFVSELTWPDPTSCRDCGHVVTRKRALELLPPFMSLPPDRREQVVQSVHTLVDRFPSDSHELDAGTTQASHRWHALLIGLRCPAPLRSAAWRCLLAAKMSGLPWSRGVFSSLHCAVPEPTFLSQQSLQLCCRPWTTPHS